ncbi:MAG TPA: pyridoxamine 5'-phosphate oxidase family protein [Candidatus Faecaligallichristensenella faecipullorum]|nr:pyridoxamine 5'-phosphate oxidase family protein [Candidatus Faecaligallichristensenella faecipullorum]
MFRIMRRGRQALTRAACEAVLYRGSSGVLALAGDMDYPYAVPISYGFDGEKLYFHSAKAGHKIDAVRRNPKASFCVVDQDLVVPEEYTSYFRSVIVFGTLRILEDEREKRAAIEKLALKYAPDDAPENRQRAIDREWAALCVLEMTPQHISGKEAVELIRSPKTL